MTNTRFAGLVLDYPVQPHEKTAPLTPARDLFTVAHMGIPEIELGNWALAVSGLAVQPRSFDLAALKALPSQTIEAVHKCAGDPLDAARPTRQVANVRWAGVDVREVLNVCGARPEGAFLWASGADHGVAENGAVIHEYQKDVPMARVREGGVLIAYAMQDQPLSRKHGFPARLVVPGFYGTNSVKWLTRLELREKRSPSLFTTTLYNDPGPNAGAPDDRLPVWRLVPESQIVSPAPHAQLRVGESIEIWGWAWCGGALKRVELSTDGGATWTDAPLGQRSSEPARRHAWQRFSYFWTPRAPGSYVVMSRATGADGARQPPAGARNAMYQLPVIVM